jgi:hypothetical protein
MKASQASFDSLALSLLPESMWFKLRSDLHLSKVFRENLPNLLSFFVDDKPT